MWRFSDGSTISRTGELKTTAALKIWLGLWVDAWKDGVLDIPNDPPPGYWRVRTASDFTTFLQCPEGAKSLGLTLTAFPEDAKPSASRFLEDRSAPLGTVI